MWRDLDAKKSWGTKYVGEETTFEGIVQCSLPQLTMWNKKEAARKSFQIPDPQKGDKNNMVVSSPSVLG